MFVVHFNPVLTHPVFDSCAFVAFVFEVREDFTLKVAVEFAAQEGQDVLGREAQHRVSEQVFIQRLQGVGALEHHVGGELGLVNDPVVVHAQKQVVEQGVDLAGERRENARPILAHKTIGKALRPVHIGNPDKRVVQFFIGDAVFVELARQELVAIETDLHHQREPGLDADMHQSKLPVNPVEVVAQAFPWGVLQARPSFPRNELETLAAFQGPKHTDQALRNPIALCQAARFVLFPDGVALQIDERALVLVCHRLRVGFDRIGMRRHKTLEVLQQQTLIADEPLHRISKSQRQVPFEQNPIKTGYHSGDFFTTLVHEVSHGVPPSVDGGGYHHHGG